MLGKRSPLLEGVEQVLRRSLVHGVTHSVSGALSVEARLLDVLDGHQNLSELSDSSAFLGTDLLCFSLEFVLLVDYFFKLSLHIRNVIVQLQNFLALVLLVLLDSTLHFFVLCLLGFIDFV